MGDSDELSIDKHISPYVDKVITAGSDSRCYDGQKCCWYSGEDGSNKTAASCNAANGDYSGCYRTVCNWEAAKAICDNFGYDGKTWRLPDKVNDGMGSWLYQSPSVGNNGLQLCGYSSGYSSAQCQDASRCKGSYDGNCNPNNVWTGSISGSLNAYNYNLNAGVWNGPNTNYRSNAFSVRCPGSFKKVYIYFCVL